ncbi:AAA family ATPase [Amycolatopsis sp. BJA-103]|uniref:AAA family ATPase n=1 Tax=Amycolatopsis sp. BJA-103 TaxID=1911175 RepID=UPI000C77AC26|nr:AAA family ATPase [Amycolatopsis sp. BJA-103]AUI64061.1 AAA family ATPase [Amycolatopsis sp. BJA-103]PNE16092.1 AAA family ATPase [Amycolatopsis sp. BJA-103]
MSTQDDLFLPVIELPDPQQLARYERLVGLDETKIRLRKEATLLAQPDQLRKWADEHHAGAAAAALRLLADRAPLFVFAGDVGSGKSALAESFGCDLAEHLDLPVFLYRLKLTARGRGLVGEMTTLIGEAFTHVRRQAEASISSAGVTAVSVFIVDEADALVQSREAQQMHHEDRAGVDAFLAGVDGIAGIGLPIIVVLCTNRPGAIDPAVLRRAAATFRFGRPDDQQRHAILTAALNGLSIRSETISKLVELTGPSGGRHGFTGSDLTQRLVPAAVLDAFPDRPVTDEDLLTLAADLAPSPVFTEET